MSREAQRLIARRPAATPSAGRPPLSLEARRALGAAVPAAVAPFVTGPLTGSGSIDRAWAAALALVAALAASHAKRGPLLAATAGAVLVAPAGGAVALVAAAAAIGAGALSTRHLRRRAPFSRGLCGGFTVVALLAATGEMGLVATVGSWGLALGCIGGSGLRHQPPEHRRAVRWVLGLVVAVLVVGAAGAGVGAYLGWRSVRDGTTALRLGLQSARAGDVAGAVARLDASQALLERAHADVERFGLVGRAVPVVGQNVAALEGVLAAAGDAAAQAALTAGSTSAEDLGLRQGRIDVTAIADLERPLRRLATLLAALDSEIAGRLDDPLVPALRDRLADLRDEVVRAHDDAALGAHAAAVVPHLLGASGPKRYLVLFTSPSEARGRFGFPGSFAEVVVDGGVLDLREHGSVSAELVGDLASPVPVDRADDRLVPYLAYGPTRELRSTTIVPDFPTAAHVAAEIWERSGRPPVDGVVRLDPAALAVLVRFTGPVLVQGLEAPLTADNLERFLLFDQYVQHPDEQAPRRELLETVSEVTFERLERGSLPPPQELVAAFGPLVERDHLQAVAFHPDALALLQVAGLTGHLRAPESDSLLVTNVNSGGNKIDVFLERTVRYEAAVRDGTLTGTVAVELRNGAPAADLPYYVIGSSTTPPLPLGTNHTTLLVYTSVPAAEMRVDGAPVRHRQVRTGGRWLHEVLLDLPPGASATVELDLAGELPPGPYALELVPGGGVAPTVHDVAVRADGGREVRFDGPVDRTALLR